MGVLAHKFLKKRGKEIVRGKMCLGVLLVWAIDVIFVEKRGDSCCDVNKI